jgi:hypothetical protein
MNQTSTVQCGITDPAIIIGGMHRSGTSLIRGLLGSHPDLAIWPNDLFFWRELAKDYVDQDLREASVRERLVDAVMLEEKYTREGFAFDRESILQDLDGEPYVDCGIVFAQFFRRYAARSGRPRWGVKTPFNEYYADSILSSYPRATMIQMLRDPRDVAVSIQSRGWKWDVELFCKQWRKSSLAGKNNEIKHSGSYLTIRYEDLVSDTVETVSRVCGLANLEVVASMFEMKGQANWQGSNSFFDDIGRRSQPEGVTQTAVGRYQDRLSDSDRQFIERELEDELVHWGYDLAP